LLMLMRYDFWPNHLLAAREAGTRMILAAAVLQENSQYFKPLLRGFYRSLFNLFDHIYTVSAKDTRAFREVFGCRQAETAGDPRFDQVVLRSRNTEKVSRLKLLYENRTVLLAGSVWPPDEALLLQAWLQLEKRPSLILVPHQVDPENMQRLCRELENRKISFMKASAIDRSFDPEQQVLLIDRTGYLAELYRLGSIAYIGGGFGVNVHNTLEPAVYGIPVLFGPRYHNSPEARELLLAGGATVIHDDTSLFTVLKNLTDDCSQRKTQGAAAAAFVQQRTGATALISGYIEKDYLKWKKKELQRPQR
ncbi:MAG: 3-deoxy-D-manno-octulosonic acid transferase, partial [Chlorobium limicola]